MSLAYRSLSESPEWLEKNRATKGTQSGLLGKLPYSLLSLISLLGAVPLEAVGEVAELPQQLAPHFQPPAAFVEKEGSFRSPLVTKEGNRVQSASQWAQRRQEILDTWYGMLGPWPDLIESPQMRTLASESLDGLSRHQGFLSIGIEGQESPAYLMVPHGDGPFPAVVVVFYDAETGAGLGTPLRDFALQLARRGFVTLSLAPPGAGFLEMDPEIEKPARRPYFGPPGEPVQTQPLSALAYAAANAHRYLANRAEVDAERIGIMGHSFGGKWAMFASCLYEPFACAVWSDPGIVFDERDRRKENPGGSVNYWDPWYLGMELGEVPREALRFEFRGLPSEDNPRTGSYRELIRNNHDLIELHALMAPRPFLVSGGTADRPERWKALNHSIEVNRLLGYSNRVAMTNRDEHAPTEESNEQAYQFLEWWLQPAAFDNE